MDAKTFETEQLTIKFEGDSFIDADLLLGSLGNIVTAYRETVNYCFAGLDYDLRIKPFERGSFEVCIETAKAVLPAIAGYIPNAVECVSTFIDIVKLKHELKGKKPASVEVNGSQVALTTATGDVHYHDCNIYNTYVTYPSINEALSGVFTSMDSSSRPAVSLRGRECELRIPQSDYGFMRTPMPELEDIANTQTVRSVIHELLPVKTPDFLGNARWSFMYKGRAIQATIADEKFMEDVRKGRIAFFSGIELPVKMQIEVTMDESLNPIRYSYTILEVTGDPVNSREYEKKQTVLENIMIDDES